MTSPSASPGGPSLRKTVLDDLRRGVTRCSLRRELSSIYEFYLDGERKERLAGMGKVQRSVYLLAWLLKSMFLKLSPGRRVGLLVAMVLAIQGPLVFNFGQWDAMVDLHPVAVLLLVVILMLELKDKLLARDELEIGRQVQLALLPQNVPAIPGWTVWMYTCPANDVGGDLVDWLPVSAQKTGIALGDVAGKGLGAALLMAKLQSTLRALAPDTPSLVELGQRLNTILCRDGLPNRFATLVYLEIASDTSTIRLLNAGHLPPLVIRTQNIEKMQPSVPPVGMFPAIRYSEQNVSLEPGDTLLVFSDGLTEAANSQGVYFGDQPLTALLPRLRGLPPSEAGALILSEVERFKGEGPPHDDLSLVLIQRNA